MEADLEAGVRRRRFLSLMLGAACSTRAAARPLAGGSHDDDRRDAAREAGGRWTSERALAELRAGNARFERSRMRHGHQDGRWWHGLASSQHPFAVVLSCSDSRVAPEVVFDQGLGDLFVVRTAGHVVDDASVASVEYAAAHLGVPLVVVLGHERCGAVQATVETLETGAAPEGHLERLVAAIRPAVAGVKGKPGDIVDLAVRANVDLAVSALSESKPLLSRLVETRALTIVGARYDLDTGHVDLLQTP
jgi:carbonic anhydrase